MIRLIAWRAGHNFGDELTEYILRRDYDAKVTAADWDHGTIVGAGSILQLARPAFRGIVFTTGTVEANPQIACVDADFRAVRGRLTQAALAAAGVSMERLDRCLLGDIGILAAPKHLARANRPRGIAWLPHYADDRKFDMPRIEITDPPVEVIANVAQHSRIVTSSLHGLILADSLGIPHVWNPSPEVIGGSWKFDDYLSSFGLGPIVANVTRLTARELMVERQTALRSELDRIVEELT